MAQLAIKGHPTRGTEIIEILEMLGGKNYFHMNGFTEEFIYYICEEKDNQIHSAICPTNQIVFTIEKYLEKYPYKVGDKVVVKGLSEYPKSIHFMKWFDDNIHYSFDNETWFLPSALNPYKEETMGKAIFDANAQCCDISNRLIKEETMEEKLCIGLFPVSNGRKEIIPCDGYEVVSDEGKFYVVKKPPKYPKTHVECCEILYPNENFQTVAQPIKGHNGKKLFALQKLLVCRDAYWKIAGEQMGLGKPWEPDWNNEDETKYCIYTTENIISFEIFGVDNKILAFPTEEMRDAFYENFNVLIELCKELL